MQMSIEQNIQQWFSENTQLDEATIAQFVSFFEQLAAEQVIVSHIAIGEQDGAEDNYIVAKLFNTETEKDMEIGFDGEYAPTGFSKYNGNSFTPKIYSNEPELGLTLLKCYVLDYLSDEDYTATTAKDDHEREWRFDCALDALSSHLNNYHPEFYRSDELHIESDVISSIKLIFNENDEVVLSVNSINDNAMMLLYYLSNYIYKDKLLTVIRYASREQREQCHRMVYGEETT